MIIIVPLCTHLILENGTSSDKLKIIAGKNAYKQEVSTARQYKREYLSHTLLNYIA